MHDHAIGCLSNRRSSAARSRTSPFDEWRSRAGDSFDPVGDRRRAVAEVVEEYRLVTGVDQLDARVRSDVAGAASQDYCGYRSVTSADSTERASTDCSPHYRGQMIDVSRGRFSNAVVVETLLARAGSGFYSACVFLRCSRRILHRCRRCGRHVRSSHAGNGALCGSGNNRASTIHSRRILISWCMASGARSRLPGHVTAPSNTTKVLKKAGNPSLSLSQPARLLPRNPCDGNARLHLNAAQRQAKRRACPLAGHIVGSVAGCVCSRNFP